MGTPPEPCRDADPEATLTLIPDGADVESRVRATRFGSVRWYDRLGSTNEVLLAEAGAGGRDGLVVVADEQTAGRGRLDRRWEAPPGTSLLVSVLVRPHLDAASRPLVLLAGALAAVEAVRASTALDVGLKWPNDLVVGDHKLGGLLAEVRHGAIVVGFGCNVAWERMPDDLASSATSIDIASGGPPPARADLLVAWLARLDALLGVLEAGRADEVVAAAASVMTTLGREVGVELTEGVLVGRAQRLGALGELVVTDADGATHVIAVGDVVHLRARS